MKKYLLPSVLLLISLLTFNQCIEPVELNEITFESNLVVRAVLTNELKHHTIELSRSIPIDSTTFSPEKNASVSIVDDLGNTFNYQETEDGVYTSVDAFSAQPDRAYSLKIQTNNGHQYSSSAETLPESASIGNIDLVIEKNEIEEIDELVIKVNSNPGSSGNGKYYRYEYDETYKIKTLIWSRKKLLIISDTQPYEFELVDKTEEEDGVGFCYATKKSKGILLTETKSLSGDQVVGYPIRQIPLDSYIIGQRYSILIKQYIINQNTYDFYTLLDKFSDPDNIFSQTQVGNIPSNIKSETNPKEDKVIGFFEVSNLSSKRVFFNRDEVTNSTYKNYRPIAFCAERIKPDIEDNYGRSPLLNKLRTNWIFQGTPDIPSPEAPYILALKVCGDCSHLGAVNPPEFWTE